MDYQSKSRPTHFYFPIDGIGALIIAVSLVLLFTLIAIASLFPAKMFSAIENIPGKLLISIALLLMAAKLGWSIFVHYHVPSARRFVITLSLISVGACFASPTFPSFIRTIERASLHVNEGKLEAELKSNANSQGEAWGVVSSMGFGSLLSIVSMLYFGHLSKRADNI